MWTDTVYLGQRLPHPFIAGASPLGYRLDTMKRLEDAGIAAIVLHSLFEEQITLATEGQIAHADVYDAEFADLLRDFPSSSDYPLAPDAYAEHIFQAKKALHVPIIASLNGRTGETWLKFARTLEQAGADAIELNIYDVATDLDVAGITLERHLVDLVHEVKSHLVSIPVAVKLPPFFTSFGHLARQLDVAGVDALVLFNRFYQPDIDIRTMSVTTQVELSTSSELLLRLRWLALLYGRLRASLAVTGGVTMPDDGIKAVLAGANVVELVSAILRHGPSHIGIMLRGLERWMEWHKMATIDEMRGRASLAASKDPGAFERAHYIRTLHSWTT
jgi:dihydroorotate dehydrogenase (fumarate)